MSAELILERTEQSFWATPRRAAARQPAVAWRELLRQVRSGSAAVLHEAVESGVPTRSVALIAGALRTPAAAVMDLIGVSETTFRRKEEAGEPLPEVAGHRVMALLRVAATLQRLLDESGHPTDVAAFDLESWLRDWLWSPLPEFGGKTPAALLRNPEGQRALDALLERMRGGLPA